LGYVPQSGKRSHETATAGYDVITKNNRKYGEEIPVLSFGNGRNPVAY
jgi:hypothetical protein